MLAAGASESSAGASESSAGPRCAPCPVPGPNNGARVASVRRCSVCCSAPSLRPPQGRKAARPPTSAVCGVPGCVGSLRGAGVRRQSAGCGGVQRILRRRQPSTYRRRLRKAVLEAALEGAASEAVLEARGGERAPQRSTTAAAGMGRARVGCGLGDGACTCGVRAGCPAGARYRRIGGFGRWTIGGIGVSEGRQQLARPVRTLDG